MGSIPRRSTPDQRGCSCRRIFEEALLSSASLSTSPLAPSFFRDGSPRKRNSKRDAGERACSPLLREKGRETENDVLMISQRGSRLGRVLSDSSGIRGARLWASLSASGSRRWGQVLLTVERSLVSRRWCRGSSDPRRSRGAIRNVTDESRGFLPFNEQPREMLKKSVVSRYTLSDINKRLDIGRQIEGRSLRVWRVSRWKHTCSPKWSLDRYSRLMVNNYQWWKVTQICVYT